jgi:ribosome biogenesis GTPase
MAADGTRRGGGLDDEQVMAANVDVALLVAGLDHDFNLRRIERYLAVARSSGIDAVVVSTRPMSATTSMSAVSRSRRSRRGWRSCPCRRRTGDGLEALLGHLRPGTTTAILGSSGVGKSTILNALLGEDRQRTGAVRESDSRGRHTTTHRSCSSCQAGHC